MENCKFYINIGRQFCSGGLEIGKRLSEIFNIPYFDKELLNLASRVSGISKEFFEQADEAPSKFSTGFLGIGLSSTVGISNYSLNNVIGGDNLFNIQSDVIRAAADKSSAIFIGRCADYILRNEPNTLNVFIYADLSDRIANVRKDCKIDNADSLSEKQITDIIKKNDKKRSEYYNYYTFKTWGAKESYDLCLNISRLGKDTCINIIENTIRDKFIF